MQTSWESPRARMRLMPFLRAYFIPKIKARYSATLLVAMPTPSRKWITYQSSGSERATFFEGYSHLLAWCTTIQEIAYHTSIISSQHRSCTSLSRISFWSTIKLNNTGTLHIITGSGLVVLAKICERILLNSVIQQGLHPKYLGLATNSCT